MTALVLVVVGMFKMALRVFLATVVVRRIMKWIFLKDGLILEFAYEDLPAKESFAGEIGVNYVF